jgi:hypothetical protein
MPILLLDRRLEPQRIDGFADQGVSALDDSTVLPGPAVIVEAADPAPKAAGHARESRQITGLIASRPLACREQHGGWVEIDSEAADHWTQMTGDLRRRLIDDTQASLDVDEFKQATDGASTSIITNNWVYSGSPRVYRIAGRLRDFVAVLGDLTRG